jgi:hypothetical protein
MSDQAKATMRQEYDKQKAEREKMTAAAHQYPVPTPTQEENDLFALGLLNPDDKKSSGEPAAPQSRPVTPHSTAQEPHRPPGARP